MSKYGERLRELRAERKLSLREVHERGGPSKDVMSLSERGVHKPHPRTLVRIALALDMPVSDLEVELKRADAPKGDPGPEWALMAPEEVFDTWVSAAAAPDLHTFWNTASTYSRELKDAESRARLLDRVQRAIDQFFRLYPVEDFIDRRPPATGERESKSA